MSFKGLNYGQLQLEQDPSRLTLSSRHNHPLLSLNSAITENTSKLEIEQNRREMVESEVKSLRL